MVHKVIFPQRKIISKQKWNEFSLNIIHHLSFCVNDSTDFSLLLIKMNIKSMQKSLLLRDLVSFKSMQFRVCKPSNSMTIIGSPVGYVVSYLLLWLYFYLDCGYFTQVNIQFVYEVSTFFSCICARFLCCRDSVINLVI